MISASGLLGGHAHFLHWGVIQISLANLIVVVLMLIVFVLAVVLQFPHSHDDDEQPLSEARHVQE
jgi:uncharacterized membrane protein